LGPASGFLVSDNECAKIVLVNGAAFLESAATEDDASQLAGVDVFAQRFD
jgi:hypothetical protein